VRELREDVTLTRASEVVVGLFIPDGPIEWAAAYPTAGTTTGPELERTTRRGKPRSSIVA
jgi:hypothetical protein